MEIRANYLLVGLFTLAMFVGATAFIFWLASRSPDDDFREYDISFTESVKGLSVNSDVLFVGIKVGTVTAITISKENPGEVRVRISIDDDAPVRANSIAQLEPRGITGASIINISGGTQNSPLLNISPGQVGVILTEPSSLSSLVSRVPDIVSGAERILSKLDAMLNEKNIEAVGQILESGRSLTHPEGSLPTTLSRVGAAADRLDRVLAHIEEKILPGLQAGSAALDRTMQRTEATLSALEPGLKQFAGQGLVDLRLLVGDLRNLTQLLMRVGQKLENDPRRFFFGDQRKEYQNK
ncbi:MAG: MlaD family protein [Desulfovibrio sp.]|jgi:phospholipid/cholesterol/gamma-HCH transport system substrate-binding protein|nr:MlaD family protein [Desulfovibrio sp.]